MLDHSLAMAILHSLKDPLLFADTGHVVRYMNRAAVAHYAEGEALLGSSLLECHNALSQQIIVETMAAMRDGLEERLITDNDRRRIYMRAVRDVDGALLGYYERYEPPAMQGAQG